MQCVTIYVFPGYFQRGVVAESMDSMEQHVVSRETLKLVGRPTLSTRKFVDDFKAVCCDLLYHVKTSTDLRKMLLLYPSKTTLLVVY